MVSDEEKAAGESSGGDCGDVARDPAEGRGALYEASLVKQVMSKPGRVSGLGTSLAGAGLLAGRHPA